MEIVKCPFCQFPSHPVSSSDNRYWKYSCERCKRLFTIDVKTGKPV